MTLQLFSLMDLGHNSFFSQVLLTAPPLFKDFLLWPLRSDSLAPIDSLINNEHSSVPVSVPVRPDTKAEALEKAQTKGDASITNVIDPMCGVVWGAESLGAVKTIRTAWFSSAALREKHSLTGRLCYRLLTASFIISVQLQRTKASGL